MRDKAHDVTQEDILRERALVLARAGESVHDALKKLSALEKIIEIKSATLKAAVDQEKSHRKRKHDFTSRRSLESLITEINSDISKYNETREYAKLRYYYLIVTREALGLRRHTMVEKHYKIPPKKAYMTRR